MTIKEKIKKHRQAYILRYGKEPKSVIIGYEIMGEIKKEMPSRFIDDLFGMSVIVDKDRPTRVETGDFET